MAKMYVPGYGYVDSNDPGTRGSGSDYGSSGGRAQTGDYWNSRDPNSQAETSSETAGSSYTSFQDWRNSQTRYDNTLPIAYRPPTTSWLSADRQETQIRGLPAIYRAKTVGDAMGLYWSDPASKQLIINAARIHYAGNPNFNEQWAEGFWSDIVNQANSYGARAPWETLQMILSGQGASPDSPGGSPSGGGSSGGGGGYGGGGGGGQVSLTNPTSARGLLLQTMQNVLGRNPSDDEYRQFLKALNQAEMGNPQTVDVQDGMVVGSGGVDPGMVAMEYVQGLDEFNSAEGQRALSSFMQVLGA